MSLLHWGNPPLNIDLKENEIQLWLINLRLENKSVKAIQPILNVDEIAKANKFHFDKDKKSFIVARGSLRIVLSNYLDVSEKKIIFKYNDYGKPFLDYPKRNNIKFNLSHSNDFAIIAVTKSDIIGVDIEHIKSDFEIKNIVKKYFSKNEISELYNLPLEKQQRAFYYCWTRKEAYIKAQGKGLSIPLDSFDVTLDEESPKIVRIENETNLENWNLYDKYINDNYCSAVVNYGKKKNIASYFIEDVTKI